MGMNMIFIPFPIMNYPWGYNPYMMPQQFYYPPAQMLNPYLISNFNNTTNQESN